MNNKIPLLDFSISIKKMGQDTYLIRGQEAWKINEVAEVVCMLSDGKNTIADIIKKISLEFNEQAGTIEKDITELIDFLMKQEIIEVNS